MKLLLVVFTLALLLTSVIVLVVRLRYNTRHLLVLLFLAWPAVFLGRWNQSFYFFLLGRPYLGYEILTLGWIVLFAVLMLLRPGRMPLRVRGVMWTLAGVCVLGVLSGLLNSPSSMGLGYPLQAQVRWLLPLIAAWLAVKAVPEDLESSRLLRTSFVLVYGLAVPAVVIFSALFVDQLRAIFGWEQRFAEGEAGFVRGWSPLGSPISTGIVLVAAYALCLGQMLRKRSVLFHGVAAGICAIAVLLTLSRSVVIALVLLHLFVFRRQLLRNPGRVLAAVVVLAVLTLPAVMFLSQRYSFGRLANTGEYQLRLNSALASLEIFAESPIWGQGPGLLYSDVRVPPLLASSSGGPIVVGSHFSAREPHNMYLLFLVEYGFLGFALLVAMILFFAARLRRARWAAEQLPEEQPMSEALRSMIWVLALFGLTWSSMFIYPKVATAVWAFLLIAMHHATALEAEAEGRVGAELEHGEYAAPPPSTPGIAALSR